MIRRLRWLTGLVALAIAGGGLWLLSRPRAPRAIEAQMQVADVLGGEPDAGFARADAPRRFIFPRDHGPHPDFRSEWWYLTGNLTAADGHAFGYQVTLFRNALAPGRAERPSDWAARQFYLGHFAVSDIAAREHHAHERFSRAALGLAGAQAAPFRVWLTDWSLTGAARATWPMRVRLAEGEVAIDLRLARRKPVVLQGEQGLSRKGATAGNASYYYSYPRLASEGTVTVGGRRYTVRGLSWMDREWSTSALEPGVVGWDWFALQLDDGRDVMLYQLRREGGGASRFSKGSLIDAGGRKRTLAVDDFTLEPTAWWTSPESGVRYPTAWRVAVPGAGLRLDVEARFEAQEWRGAFQYWEGAVAVRGDGVGGRGYMELTGYGDAQALSR